MIVQNITYERSFKVADYETEKFCISAMLEENDNVGEKFTDLKMEVLAAFRGKSTVAPKTVAPIEPVAPKTVAPIEPVAPKTVAPIEPVVSPKPVVPKKKVVKKKSAFVAYDRNKEQHKREYVNFIETILPNWRKTDLESVKNVSLAMEGVDMLDSDGKIMDSFKAEVSAKLGIF